MRLDRQRDAEPRAAAVRRRHVDPALVRIHDLPHDGQAESRSLGLGGEERVEDLFRHLRRHSGTVVGDVDHHRRHRHVSVGQQRAVGRGIRDPGGDLDASPAFERLVGVDEQVAEHLRQLVLIGAERRQIRRQRDVHDNTAARRLPVSHRNGRRHRLGERGAIHLQTHRPHKREHFLDDGVGHLGFADDVAHQRLDIGIVRHLAAQQRGEHFDAAERVLDFVRHDGRHLAHRREAVAQPLALFHLLDVREVLEEQRGAYRRPAFVAHERQGVAQHGIGGRQAKLGAIGKRFELEGAAKHAHHVWMAVQHVRVGHADNGIAGPQSEQPPGLIVDEDEVALAIDRQDAVAHIGDHVAEEGIRGFCVFYRSLGHEHC